MLQIFRINAAVGGNIVCSVIVALLLAGLTACTAEPTPELDTYNCWTRPAVMGVGTAAVYFTIVNNGGASDVLTDVSSDAAESARLHETQIEMGIMSMIPISHIKIPAKGRIELQPGGFHVMLVGLKQDLSPGETVSVMLYFEKNDVMAVEAEVREP
jgi:copper(I)-binding protein